MAETSRPWVDAWVATDDEWEEIFGPPGGFGVIVDDATYGLDSLKVTAGPGAAEVSTAAGAAMLAGRRYDNTAAVVTTCANPGATERIDRIVVDVDRNTPGLSAITVERIAGTPGAGAPSIFSPPAGHTYLPLGKVTRRANSTSILASDIVDERWKLGLPVQAVSSSLRPPHRDGQIIREYDTGAVKISTGTAYVELLGAGGRKLYVPGGRQSWAGGLALSTNVSGANWADFSAAPVFLSTLTLPGVTGVSYRVYGRAWLTQTSGEPDVWGRLAIRRADNGQVLHYGEPDTATDSPVAKYQLLEIDWLYTGTGTPLTVKLSGQKIAGQWNVQFGNEIRLLGYDEGLV